MSTEVVSADSVKGICSICGFPNRENGLDRGDAVYGCAKKHIFHTICIQSWVVSRATAESPEKTCPICRGPIRINRIFPPTPVESIAKRARIVRAPVDPSEKKAGLDAEILAMNNDLISLQSWMKSHETSTQLRGSLLKTAAHHGFKDMVVWLLQDPRSMDGKALIHSEDLSTAAISTVTEHYPDILPLLLAHGKMLRKLWIDARDFAQLLGDADSVALLDANEPEVDPKDLD
jgi:hypothetical protein